MDKLNIFSDIPVSVNNEIFDVIVKSKNLKIERIISRGHRTAIDE